MATCIVHGHFTRVMQTGTCESTVVYASLLTLQRARVMHMATTCARILGSVHQAGMPKRLALCSMHTHDRPTALLLR